MSERNHSEKCILSVDVEDWFHILDVPSSPPMAEWSSLPSRVEENFRGLLALFRENRLKATCFFLGWIAERYPHLVREAQAEGHEIASHGYGHELAFGLSADEFFHDAIRARSLLEDVSGSEVVGYRSAGFSTTRETPWFFDKLAEAGYRYDSSVFPAARGHGGMKGAPLAPYAVTRGPGDLVEFPITVAEVLGRRLCFFGGGYLRLFPYTMIRTMAGKVLKEGRPVIFYVHPREIDPRHPRLPMNLKRRFKSYVNLGATYGKLGRLIEDFAFTTFADYLTDHPELREAT
jgi:polysaccharide deacetylase family protein (PEP-CTERM system associated)